MYFNELIKDNITYSIDKIRLKTYITNFDFSKIEYRFKTIWSNYVDKYYNASSYKLFKHNYNIKIAEGQSFFFGFISNAEKISQNELAKYNFTVEFNPNKLKDNRILLYILSVSTNWFIKSFDLAMDLPINILNLIYDKEYKRVIKTVQKDYDDKTIYIGSKEASVSYKIYNKKKESNLNFLHDLTRVEITNKLDDYSIIKVNSFNYNASYFPSLYLTNYLYTFDDYSNKTTLACLYAVLSGYSLNMLTDHYKTIIKDKLVTGGCKINFDNIIATKVFKNCIYHYFPFLLGL